MKEKRIIRCPNCGSSDVEKVGQQISPWPGGICRSCDTKMRPGMPLLVYLLVILIGVGLAGAFSWGIFSYLTDDEPGPKHIPGIAFLAIGLGLFCAGWAVWQLRLPAPIE